MATRSTISMMKEDGSILSIYCHWDGYPDNQLPLLENYYNTKEKIEALLSLGNLSFLEKSIDCPEGHSFENPVDDHCVFYGRGRGEENQEAVVYVNKADWRLHANEAFNYLFEDGKWNIK
jgi:hypothetical protein